MKKHITVIGLYGQSALFNLEHLPTPGESVLSRELRFEGGGKGYNQALCAQRMGCDTSFFTAVGDDSFGESALDEMRRDGISDPHTFVFPGKNTAFAAVIVDSRGENEVIVDRGAQLELNRERLAAIESCIATSSVLLLQCETPIEVLQQVTELAEKNGVYVILNPAPATQLPKEVLARVDLLTPNWTEAHQLCNLTVTDDRTPLELAVALHRKGCKAVAITMGSKGAFVYDGEQSWQQKPFSVQAVDTTGAGDTFNGAVAAQIAKGETLPEAIRFATAASALSVCRRGVLDAIPYFSETMRFLEETRII